MRKNINKEWTKRRRRDEFVKRKMAEKGYAYQPSISAWSNANFLIHDFSCYKSSMIGVQALEEILMFYRTSKRFESPIWYELALNVALQKVRNKKFDNKEKIGRIYTTADVEQSIKALLATAGIEIPVKDFIRNMAA